MAIWKSILGLLLIYLGAIFYLKHYHLLELLMIFVGVILFATDLKKIKQHTQHKQTIVLLTLLVAFMIITQLIKINFTDA